MRLIRKKAGSPELVNRHDEGATSVNRRLCAFTPKRLVYANTLKELARAVEGSIICAVLETTSPEHRRRPNQERRLTVAFRKGRHFCLDDCGSYRWPVWVRRLMGYRRTLPQGIGYAVLDD